MAGYIFEFFGYRVGDKSEAALNAVKNEECPFVLERCEKTFNDGTVSGVCSIRQATSEKAVICCPIRLYADDYQILRNISDKVFLPNLPFIAGKDAITFARDSRKKCVAVFGKKWGGELRLPQKLGKGGYFVDWVLAFLDEEGHLIEFTAVEVQTIDTTGNYRNGFSALKNGRILEKTTVGLNWENVSKRILPQLIYKGQVLQREELCKSGLFFVCPQPVFNRIADRLGGASKLLRFTLQPAAITFIAHDFPSNPVLRDGLPTALEEVDSLTTTVYRVQEAFNNVELPDENIYKTAILHALGKK
ncbi:Restriction endonuclease NotI [Kingella potus]|uniref:Restriction endonuclease NotI n=1 Tax=Kingella potus TaxID=265175 RepID=A0A377R524_9NEIS|nr:NotI family restriction endonuclease [Kingella potus]UOP00292.1 hypothetical protein LVJ84_10330 [Kingella potus]STR02645.1 Restriction endonuclease NotI [Kingella potus]